MSALLAGMRSSAAASPAYFAPLNAAPLPVSSIAPLMAIQTLSAATRPAKDDSPGKASYYVQPWDAGGQGHRSRCSGNSREMPSDAAHRHLAVRLPLACSRLRANIRTKQRQEACKVARAQRYIRRWQSTDQPCADSRMVLPQTPPAPPVILQLPVMRTSASLQHPNVRLTTPLGSAMEGTHSSSRLTIAMLPGVMFPNSSALASATPFKVPPTPIGHATASSHLFRPRCSPQLLSSSQRMN